MALGTGNLNGLTTGDQTPGDQVRGDWAGDEGDGTGPGRGGAGRAGVETGVPLLSKLGEDHCPGVQAVDGVDGAIFPGLYGLYLTGRGRAIRLSALMWPGGEYTLFLWGEAINGWGGGGAAGGGTVTTGGAAGYFFKGAVYFLTS